MNQKREENNFLYFLEGMACIGVVFLHCMFPSWMGVLVCGLVRFAVPLFFMVSGYYMCYTSKNDRQLVERMQNKICHIGSALFVSIIFYLFWTMFWELRKQGSSYVLDWFRTFLKPQQLFSMLVLNDFTVIGGHQWFLAALLYCYCIFLVIAHLGYLQHLLELLGCKIFILLLSIHVWSRILLALWSVNDILGIPVYLWFRNWLFMALPFLIAGYLIRQNQDVLLQMFSAKKMCLLFLVGILLTTVENLFVYQKTGDDRELYFGTFLMVFSMFLYALRNPGQVGISWIGNIGRRYLLFIYIAHLAVAEGIDVLLYVTGMDKLIWISNIKPFFVVAMTIVGAVFWEKLFYGRVKRKSR